ncbi:MAG: class III signal peptide-containing protein [Methanobrevibacter ruminantium]|uniref:class III signal peptide-containing protein n=1 Tax=Methanobrevibacter ruminantium TaxID=83816 RepID=UPI0026EFB8DB|nr:class III signal peptide-containing protein [Methanobrevibacter ruminantium]MCI5736991.1 class III signal peptide-containing protein [Methanobrevibacter ruminantium]MDD6047906.1 class III signal peptide-containing protein [Methanobrevibacter ruminantium]MDO5842992.1 class III signal peptide-containing protein [Methanobrevibacter ruminantium]
MRNIDLNFPSILIHDNKGQGAVELILIIGGIIVIILLVVSMYKSYIVDLGTEIDSNEINTLNSSFGDIASKFE